MSQENNVTLIPEEITGIVEKDNSQNMFLSELSPQSITKYDVNKQAEIQALADQIDVTKSDKVSAYAEIPFQKGISELKSFMERMKGTEEDKQTVKSISELSEKVNNEINDIKIVAKEKGFFEKIFEFFKGDPHDNTLKKIDSCSKLLDQLAERMATEIAIISERQGDAEQIIKTNLDVAESLEQYLIAGYIAIERIDKEIDTLKTSNSLMIREQVELTNLENGMEVFKLNMLNIERTRLATGLALMDTLGSKACLEKLETNFKSTMKNLLLIFAQQSTNTLLGYTVRNAIDSHKNITKLTTAMMESNAKNLKKNYEDVAKLLTEGVADANKMKQCAAVILEGAQEHNKILSEYVDHLDEHKKEINEALEPIREFFNIPAEGTNKESANNSTNLPSQSSGSLKF